MSVIEIRNGNRTYLIIKDKIIGIVFSHDDLTIGINLEDEVFIKFIIKDSLIADTFYQKIRNSILSENKIDQIIYDAEKGVL